MKTVVIAVIAAVIIFVASVAWAFEAPDGALYGVMAEGKYFIAKNLVDAANGSPPRVMFGPDWKRLEMKLDGNYYVYTFGQRLPKGLKTDFCFDIGNDQYLPHALITDQRIKEEDTVDNTVGGYNFRLDPK